MDDFIISNLRESKNEWCCYLVDILTPLIRDGVRSMFKQSWTMCMEKGETNKYLMTFQNLLSLVKNWNSVTVEEERKRIVEQSGCNYLEELIVCVHVIHLKVMTHIRVGNKQKKIDISLPKLDDFIHRIYINVARQLYKNVYLFENGLDPLTQQKYNRELEIIIQQGILQTVRDSIPKEQIIRSFMDESVEQEEEVIIERFEPEAVGGASLPTHGDLLDPIFESSSEPPPPSATDEAPIPSVPSVQNVDDNATISRIRFNDTDYLMNPHTRQEETRHVPKPTLHDTLTQRQQKQPQHQHQLDLDTVSLDDLVPTQEATAPTDDLNTLLDIQEI